MSQPKSRSSKNNFLNKWIGKKNQLGQMFRGSDLNYTAAITTKCPHFLQIVLENKLTRKYPWQPKIRDSVSFWAIETCEYSNSSPIKSHNILLNKVIFSKIS